MKKNKEYPSWLKTYHCTPTELMAWRIVNPRSSDSLAREFHHPDFDVDLYVNLRSKPIDFCCQIFPRPVCLFNYGNVPDSTVIISKKKDHGQIITVTSFENKDTNQYKCHYFLSEYGGYDGLRINLPPLAPSTDPSTSVAIYDQSKTCVDYNRDLHGATRFRITYDHHTPILPLKYYLNFDINLPGEFDNCGSLNIKTIPKELSLTRKFQGRSISSHIVSPPYPRVSKESINPDDPSTYSDICQQIYLYALSLIPQESIK